MGTARAGLCRIAHPRPSSARLLGGAVAVLLLGIPFSRAETPAAPRAGPATVWVCSDPAAGPAESRPPFELAMKDGLLIEQPLGSPRYRVLTDSAFAIIAVDDHADYEPVLGMVNIFVSALVIDKSTGHFAMTTIVSDKVLAPRTGRCRMFEPQARAVGDGVVASSRGADAREGH